jgi:hypothetical protein
VTQAGEMVAQWGYMYTPDRRQAASMMSYASALGSIPASLRVPLACEAEETAYASALGSIPAPDPLTVHCEAAETVTGYYEK